MEKTFPAKKNTGNHPEWTRLHQIKVESAQLTFNTTESPKFFGRNG